MAKKIVAVFLFILIFICGCGKKTVESINLSIPNRQAEYDINTEIPIEISVLPKGVDTSTLGYISDEGITFTDSQIITGNVEGTYYFYVTSGDIQSNVLSIKVVDIAAREEAVARWLEKEQAQEAEAQRLAEEQAAKEAESQQLAEEQAAKEAEAQRLAEEQAAKEAEAQRQAEEQAAQNAQTSEQAEGSSGTQNNDSGSSGDASNFNTYDNSSQQQTEATYVLNTHTMKIHHPSCSSVKKIAPQNYATSNSSLDDLISQGYSTCGNCFK